MDNNYFNNQIKQSTMCTYNIAAPGIAATDIPLSEVCSIYAAIECNSQGTPTPAICITTNQIESNNTKTQ